MCEGSLGNSDFDVTIFNFILPSGTVLNTDKAPTGGLARRKRISRESNSLNGLGGYHGSVHVKNAQGKPVTIYYSADAFSEILPDGDENGIAVFAQPWRNVVATLYHELSEFRTDCDVDDAIAAGKDPNGINFLDWSSRQGEEIGDFPIFTAGQNLQLVFKQVKATGKSFLLPIQFQYSNGAHRPEGPIAKPRS